MSVRTQNSCSHVNSQEKLPKSLPKIIAVFSNIVAKPRTIKGSFDVLFEIGETQFDPNSCQNVHACSLDSMKTMFSESKFLEGSFKLGNSFGGKLGSISPSSHSASSFVAAFQESEIDISEYYTCVRTHGPNPKVTHIFGDCILESHYDEDVTNSSNHKQNVIATQNCTYPTIDFLKSCSSCQKKLDGEDIYMYRGEKAFGSFSCRSKEIEIEIEIDEEMEKIKKNSPEISDMSSNSCQEMSKSILFITT